MGSDDAFMQTVPSRAEAPMSDAGPSANDGLQEGSTLGNYQLEQLLGEGSMGRVFQARHTRLGRQVALKVLRPEHARDGGFVQRFFQEARTVNQINHEHIVEIFDFVDESATGGHVYCVMELLRGQSLSALAQAEPLTLARIQRFVVQVCAALGAAHQVGVVHRDVKPDNLFVIHRAGQPDFVKVLDFGVAKLLTAEGGTTGTVDGTIIGTPAYMAPEQAAGLPVDARSDIYAVGNVLYELIAGKPPFQAPAFGHLVVQIITQPPPPLPSHLPSGEAVPPQLAALVMRCLSKEPEARPQSLAEVTTALLLLPASAEALTPADVALEASERPTQRVPVTGRWHRRAVLSVGTAALVVVAAVVTWSGMRPEPAPAVAQGAAPAEAPAPPVGAATATPQRHPPVTLTVRSFPEGAQVLRLDTGELLGVTPLVKQVAGEGAPLKLRVELAGYAPLERMVDLDTHAELEVPLVKALPSPRQPPAAGTQRASGKKSRARAVTP
ncbi:serine/threonine-protein kinase [Corallococcus macrosporus]|uniref:Serine/threonine protein kinase n=1 Tax=Corallococcus macrosporus DSM 14697 TaxID=1189310 RepID=A0A250JPL3_9BACT|nr:serine/threonine-protein kinase [Corallococcus macrosporus]ATB45321.1 serine/threonine protein kinase [Corallococcus macrosporus DSM 14697]